MAAELISPVDELTGMPLLIAPPDKIIERHNPKIANRHHIFYESTAPELQSTGGIALRNSRVQLVPVEWHNIGTNNIHTFYKRAELPAADDDKTQFRLCALACAMYLPEKVIDLKSGEPVIRYMTEKEKNYLQIAPRPKQVHAYDIDKYVESQLGDEIFNISADAMRNIRDQARLRLTVRNRNQALYSYSNLSYAYEPIRKFFTEYALRQSVDHVSASIIDEFLNTPRVDRRRFLGHWLVAQQTEVASEGLIDHYRYAYKARQLHPLMPSQPHDLVKHKLGDAIYRETVVFPELVKNLSLQYAA